MRYDPQRHLWSALSVAEVHELFAGCPTRWWLSGGWAIDHWHGSPSRPHGDIDVSTLRPALPALLHALPADLRPFAARRGHLFPLADGHDATGLHNIWVYDAGRDRFVLQINLEDGAETDWRYRRDPRITLPWESAVVSVRAVPTGTPGTQLLWKSPDPRPRDEHDLDVARHLLTPAQRRWLRDAVRLAHPHSPWADDPRLGHP
ncbi:nucleotidyltransferase domain-containing protein [Micromonospora sp. CA-248260]|uniref:nucleotidyltransferase domain-containing protein n=1 Tax=unclassified Micromonospora TaxID=2617518 RepID=UPI00343F2DE1